MSKIAFYFPVSEDNKVACAVLVPVIEEFLVDRQSNLVLVENLAQILSKLVHVELFARGVRSGLNCFVSNEIVPVDAVVREFC